MPKTAGRDFADVVDTGVIRAMVITTNTKTLRVEILQLLGNDYVHPSLGLRHSTQKTSLSFRRRLGSCKI